MKKLTNILLGFIWMLAIIPLAVTITLNFKPLYYNDIVTLDISGRSGLPVSEIRENYDELIRYNSFTGPKQLKFPTLTMSEAGRIHFSEVKTIFLIVESVGIVALIAGVILTVILRKSGNYEYLKWTAIFTVLLPTVLGTLVAISWSRFFVLFHKVMFNNDYWIFDAATDPVITILPDAFFMHALIMMIVLALGAALFCLCRYRSLKRMDYYRKLAHREHELRIKEQREPEIAPQEHREQHG